MFLELYEREDQEARLRRARAALATVTNYPIRAVEPKPQQQVPENTWPRGVYEIDPAPRGYRAFNTVYSNGDIAFHQFPAHRVTRDLVRGLTRALDRDDPLPQLHIVRPDDLSASFLPFPRSGRPIR